MFIFLYLLYLAAATYTRDNKENVDATNLSSRGISNNNTNVTVCLDNYSYIEINMSVDSKVIIYLIICHLLFEYFISLSQIIIYMAICCNYGNLMGSHKVLHFLYDVGMCFDEIFFKWNHIFSYIPYFHNY